MKREVGEKDIISTIQSGISMKLFKILILSVICIVASAFVQNVPFSSRYSVIKMTDDLQRHNIDVSPQPRSPVSVSRNNLAQFLTKVGTFSTLIMGGTAAAVFAADREAYVEPGKPKPKKVKVLETDLGIPYVVLKKGEGAYPNPGDFVVINYIGFLPDGTPFDESHEKKALSFRFGQKQVIPGLESVIELMQVGGEVTCTIPAKYAYGQKGVCIEGQSGKECLIQPNTDLKYFVKLKRVGAGYN